MQGSIVLDITCADIPGLLSAIAENHIPVYEIRPSSELRISVRLAGTDAKEMNVILKKYNAHWDIIRHNGIIFGLRKLKTRYVFAITVILIFFLTLLLPSRIFFIEIVGNANIATTQILEAARDGGLFVGVKRIAIRSESIKNHLLESLPELDWAGVNTSGCMATIHVHERAIRKEKSSYQVSHVVAACDGIIESCTVTRGRGLCKTGDVVKKGQLLISGYWDHNYIITATRSCGEIVAFTTHHTTGVALRDCIDRSAAVKEMKNYYLVIDRDIYPLLVEVPNREDAMYLEKEVERYQLKLPGDVSTPIWLMIETYVDYRQTPSQLSMEDLSVVLQESCQKAVKDQMIAGSILSVSEEFIETGNELIYNAAYRCREMIGVEIPAEPIN